MSNHRGRSGWTLGVKAVAAVGPPGRRPLAGGGAGDPKPFGHGGLALPFVEQASCLKAALFHPFYTFTIG